MSTRPEGFGMTAELKDKQDAKYSLELAGQAMKWIQHFVPDATFDSFKSEDVHEKLKDGVILCKLINALQPNGVKKVNTSKMAFKQMENIGNFLEACYAYGCSKNDMFQTVDLYEATNMAQVIASLHALGRKAGSKGKQSLGPKESDRNVRSFTEEQMRAGDGVIGLQAGYNKGASQAGQNFGKTRSILD